MRANTCMQSFVMSRVEVNLEGFRILLAYFQYYTRSDITVYEM